MTWAIRHSFNAQTHLFSLHALKVQAAFLCQIVVQGELIKKQTNQPQNIKADCNFIWMQLKNKHLIFTCDIARFLDEGSMYECISECKAWFFFFIVLSHPSAKAKGDFTSVAIFPPHSYLAALFLSEQRIQQLLIWTLILAVNQKFA